MRSWSSTDAFGVHMHFDPRGVEEDGTEWVAPIQARRDGYNGAGA